MRKKRQFNKAKRVVDAAGNNVLSQFYQRGLTGSIRTKTTDADIWNYGYDLTSQLTNALLSASGTATQEWGYAYDAMGNREQMSEVKGQGSEVTDYQPNSLNQYTSISNSMLSAPCSLLYDLNGNLTNDGVRAYTWDTQNGLIRVQDVEIVEGSKRVEFAYDFMGRRIRKDVSFYQGSGFTNQASHIFFYDGWNLVKEVSQSTNNASTNLYVWGNDLSGTLQGAGGVGGLLCSITQASGLQPQAFYPCYDHNGNVEKVLTRSGAVVAAFQYDAFGNTISETIAQGLTPNAFSHRFSTKYWDSETSLYYYGYRYYSPESGRWINRDPLEELGGLNLYGFVENAPINKHDIVGLKGNDPPNSVSCDFCQNGLARVTDDAGAKCCQEDIKTVTLRNDTSLPIPHTFLETPSRTVGYYPAWKNWPVAPGIVRPNTGHPYNPQRSTSYRACPSTLDKLERGIDNNQGGLYAFWNPYYGRNCSSWACGRLKDAGFTPPLSKWTPVFNNPWLL